jgi:hypothetical protein
VEILEHQADRPVPCERTDELGDRLVRLPLHRVARERIEPLRRIVLERQSEERGEKRVVGICLLA